VRTAGSSLPDPGFPGDDGSAAAAVTAALERYGADPDVGYHPVLAALQASRLLVPVVALLGEVEVDEAGRARDKTSDMATVLTRGRDGRTALLAFTGTDALRRWDPEARPVPVTVDRAAQAALQDGAAAIVVDVAGPVMFVVDGEDLRELARGSVLVRVATGAGVSGRYGWARPGP
jgi:SseB protein N-terminal domain